MEPFEWWRTTVGRGWSHPVKRSDVDAALKAVPVESLRHVWLRGKEKLGAEAFPYRGLTVPPDFDAEDFMLLAGASWNGLEHEPVLTVGMSGALG